MIGNPPEVETQNLGDGKKGNLETVAKMQEVARDRAGHPKVRRLALGIVGDAGSMHYLDEAKKIGQFVQSRVRYVRDANGYEQLHDPLLMIEEIEAGRSQGDCDDMALLVATLLMAIGHNPYFRLVRYRARFFGPFNHIYVTDYEKNPGGKLERLVIDAIIKNRPIGFEAPHKSGIEIQVGA